MTPQIQATGRTIVVLASNSSFPRLSESKAATVWLAKALNSMVPKGKVQS